MMAYGTAEEASIFFQSWGVGTPRDLEGFPVGATQRQDAFFNTAMQAMGPLTKGLEAASLLDESIDAVKKAGESRRIYSSRELLRRMDESGPFHNFPGSMNDEIFQGTRTVISDSYILYTKPGTITLPGKPIYGSRMIKVGEDSVREIIGYGSDKIVEGVFEIGVKPSTSGRIEVITHRFFNPK